MVQSLNERCYVVSRLKGIETQTQSLSAVAKAASLLCGFPFEGNRNRTINEFGYNSRGLLCGFPFEGNRNSAVVLVLGGASTRTTGLAGGFPFEGNRNISAMSSSIPAPCVLCVFSRLKGIGTLCGHLCIARVPPEMCQKWLTTVYRCVIL